MSPRIGTLEKSSSRSPKQPARGTRYTLGNTDAEHHRLARQALLFNPLTRRVFEAAGIRPGQRVLDLGSGAGDVALLLAEIVGPSGAVVGVERDGGSIARARERVAEAGAGHVTFVQGDVAQVTGLPPFDAAVGRWILMFVPEPHDVVRAAARLVRTGGTIAFHEVSWQTCLARSAELPLTGSAVRLLVSAFARTGADVEMGYALPRVFRDAGLPEPSIHMETLLGEAATFGEWMALTLASVRPHLDDASFAVVGDLRTLSARIAEEVRTADAVIAWPSMIGAWATKR